MGCRSKSAKGAGKFRKRSGTKTRYRVTWRGKVMARSTSKSKAKRQRRLLYAIAHGWRPGR